MKTEEITPEEIAPEGKLEAATEVSTEVTPEIEPPELAQIKEQLQHMEDNWKREQKVSSKKEEEIQRLSGVKTDIDDLKEYMKVLTAAVAEKRGETEEEFETQIPTRKPDFLKQFETLDGKRKQEQLTRELDSYRKRVESLGLGEKDDEYWEIYDLVTTGDPVKMKRANLKLEKWEGDKSQVTSKETEVSEEDKVEKLAEEKKRKWLEEKGLLDQDTGEPSAKAGRDMDKAYADGEVSEKEYGDWLRGRGKI